MASYSTLVETELKRAEIMTRKDHKQRWVTMDGHIWESPNEEWMDMNGHVRQRNIAYRDAISVCWMPIVGALSVNYRDRITAHPAIGAF